MDLSKCSILKLIERMKNETGFQRASSEKDKKIDVYSYAMTMYEVVFQTIPFQDLSLEDIINSVMRGTRPEFSKTVLAKYETRHSILNAISEGWSHDPSQRPSFDMFLPFLERDYLILVTSNNEILNKP